MGILPVIRLTKSYPSYHQRIRSVDDMFEPVLTQNIHRQDSEKIGVYLAHGGYQAARRALLEYNRTS